MKTVVILASFAPSLTNFRGEMIRAITNRGHRVIAVAPDFDDDSRAGVEALGAETQGYDLERGGVNPASDIATFKQLKALFQTLQPDVVIPYTIKPVVWGSLAASAAGVQRIVPLITGLGYAFIDGGGWKQKVTSLVARMLYSRALRKAHHVMFQNPDDEQLFRDQGLLPPGKPSSVVNGSGIDCDVFAVAPLPDKPAFLIIGRLLGNKGIREFAAASRQFIAQNPGVPVRLVGYRDESADSISQAELDSMIADGIEFVGKLSDVRPEIARASVFVLPSYREGIPRSVLEAMAMGRAIIATDVPGCRQTVTDGDNGLLIPARDSGALASAMQRLVDEPALIAKMGRRSREIAETRYDVHRVNDAIMAIVGL